MKLIYIAGPYRSPLGEYGVTYNTSIARIFGRRVARLGAYPFIPHANTGGLGGTDIPDKIWLDGGLKVLGFCDAIFLLKNWAKSAGARVERARALKLGLPIFEHLDELEVWLKGEH